MTDFRKYARFQLVVATLAAVAVLVVLLITGNVMASLSGFSVLALLGFQGLVFYRRRRGPIQDERDEAIQRRAVAAGYTAFWLFLVAWGVGVPLVFMNEGRVPLVYVAPVVWVGWWLMVSVRSITVLVLDSRGS
jgi:FtsH-binding integral membrane protein